MEKKLMLILLAIVLISTVQAYNYNCTWTAITDQLVVNPAYFADRLPNGDCNFTTAETRSTGAVDTLAWSTWYMYPPPDYSNRTLYSVAYGRDTGSTNDGYFYIVLPKATMPTDKTKQLLLTTGHYWQHPAYPSRSNWTQIDIVGYDDFNDVRRTVYNGTNIPGEASSYTVTPIYGVAIYWDACDFTCAGYGACEPTDTKPCNAATDGNGTGHCPVPSISTITQGTLQSPITYRFDATGWGSGTGPDLEVEFGSTSCDYCTPRWDCTNYVPDCSVPGTEFQNCTAVQDLDNCYGQTGLPSDLYTGDYSEFTRTCYAGGGSPQPEAPKEEILPPVEPPQEQPLVPIEVITCNPGVEYVYTSQQKVITTFRDIEVPYVVRESVGETTCGVDADGDGNKCDLNEDFVSCKSDCKIQFTEVICLDPYRCMLTESWFLQIILLLELLVSTYLLYTIFMGG